MLDSKNRTILDSWHIILILVCILGGCSLESTVDVDDPEVGREIDHKNLITKSSAIGMYNRAVGMLGDAVSNKSEKVGIFTDELTNSSSETPLWLPGDSRRDSYRTSDFSKGLEVGGGGLYEHLHTVRVTANQTRSLIQALKDSSLNALIAGTYALEGYAILMLAEDFCSGVPLTEVPFKGDIIYGAALSTEQLFTIAVSKFDSAVSIRHDSALIHTLVRVGMGRAYLGLGEYAKAVRAVEDVVETDVFYLDFTNATVVGAHPQLFWPGEETNRTLKSSLVEIVNNEGANGITWFSDPTNLDPRLPVKTITVDGSLAFPVKVEQLKYAGGAVRVPLARWVDAQMIRAEYALQQNSEVWITPLNEARATVGLPPLIDPLIKDDRIDMLFRERAFWFYLEGVRLADYRRLVRQYQRIPEWVYPVGPYPLGTGDFSFYGEAWVFLTPLQENMNNFRYHGCLHTQP